VWGVAPPMVPASQVTVAGGSVVHAGPPHLSPSVPSVGRGVELTAPVIGLR